MSRSQEEYIVSLDNCEDEPIHRPEAIQDFGLLIGFQVQTGDICYYSGNIDRLFKVKPELGTSFYQFLDGGD
ncbi:hypothetical protein [Pseudobacteriovorax antillogorgiicola]|uniref:PAS fold-containing protein n=1 Tax=Pseudobacteriovorax antillogorgiicola TaxID=1513793 RepID=A0A1Y6BG78_9BACT|nr:hypothetical protein [Pseudobacteriovorax antillogorgiicola]TCS57343.1 PAS domain-containing protein [Pseudobacteriovorax antillogorgiicola]SMF02228.1 PAS fold-containing protein [Pseudobacteriovorax antillogorgiicola]